jgi:predicted nucleic acid-binding protein
MRIYLDASAAIYAVERVPPHVTTVVARLAQPGVIKVISNLTRLECLVKPLRNHNAVLLREFEVFFKHCRRVAMTRTVFDKAAEIRARHQGYKIADALHLAAAVVHRCDAFLTGDLKLAGFSEITVDIA